MDGIGVWVAIAYGVLAAVGGVVGYRKVKSKMSLISGLVSGILLIVSGAIAQSGIMLGYWSAIVVTSLLLVVFSMRLIKTKKFMPAGVMLIAGIVTLATFGWDKLSAIS